MGEGPLRKVGALWKPKAGAKSLGSGEVTINGQKQRFVILENEYKTAGSKQPDYVLKSSDEPEADSYVPKAQGDGDPAGRDDSIPF